MTGGGDAVSPGRADYFFPVGQQPTELYVGLWVKLSDPFDPHSSGVQKILYLHDNNGVVFSALWLEIYGTAQPFWVSLVNQFSGCPSIRIAPNVAQTPIRAGEWHRYEMSLKLASSGGASDGVLKVWVDGTLNGARADVCPLGAGTCARSAPWGFQQRGHRYQRSRPDRGLRWHAIRRVACGALGRGRRDARPRLTGRTYAPAENLNAGGDIVGLANTPTRDFHAVLWRRIHVTSTAAAR